MKILVIDPYLVLAPTLVQSLVVEGHDVVYAPVWGPQATSPFVDVLCRGLGAKVDPEAWMKYIKWADVATVAGSDHRGHITKYLREQGLPVCGPGPWSVRLELDREFGHSIFQEAGLNPSTQHVFPDSDEAAAWIKQNPGRYVLKLDQTARAVAETFVGLSPDGSDVRSVLRDLDHKLRFTDGRVKLYLEDRIKGVEVGVGGFFNGEKILGELMVTFETDGGYGYDLRHSASKLLDPKKLEATLAKYHYRGSFDMNGFLTAEGEWRPVEWTPRWGSGTTEFLAHACPDLGALMYAAATGGNAPVIDPRLKGKFVVIVNARHDDEDSQMTSPTDIIMPEGPEGETLPVIRENSSFWARWPARTEEGWLSLPVLGPIERRTGEYVGEGDDLEAALRAVDDLADDVQVSGSHVEIGRAREELAPQVNIVMEFMTGSNPENEWIGRMAQSTRHIWDRPSV